MVVHRRILDSVIRHRLDLQRYAKGQAAVSVGLIAKEDRKLIELLVARFPRLKPEDIGAGRATALLKKIREERKGSMSVFHAQLRDELLALVKHEVGALDRIAQAALRVPITFNPIRAQVLRDAVINSPFAGGADSSHTLAQWVGKLAVDDRNRLTGAIQLGIRRQETVDSMVRRVAGTKSAGYADGVMAISRHQAESIVRTSVIHVANQAQVEWAKANHDVVSGLEWVSMLDERTCPVCSEMDGKVTKDAPPKHMRCRCTLVPVINLDGLAAKVPDEIEEEAA